MKTVLIIVYICFVLYHLYQALTGRTKWLPTILSLAFLCFLTCGIEYKDISDFINYRAQYSSPDFLSDSDLSLYYLFVLTMNIGRGLKFSFELWWTIMNSFAFALILLSLYKHKYNPHLFMFFFMGIYVFLFHTALKSFYGFAVFLLASGYLMKSGLSNKIKYAVLTCIAGGFHVMYYVYLIFLLANVWGENNKIDFRTDKLRSQTIGIIAVLSIMFSLLLKISGSVNGFFMEVFSFFEMGSEKLESYFERSTNLGFIIPVGLQLICLLFGYIYRNISSRYDEKLAHQGHILYHISLLQIVFYPFFMISTAFTRFISYLSPISICIAGRSWKELKLSHRKTVLLFGSFIMLGYYFRNLILTHLWEYYFVSLFQNRFI